VGTSGENILYFNKFSGGDKRAPVLEGRLEVNSRGVGNNSLVGRGLCLLWGCVPGGGSGGVGG